MKSTKNQYLYIFFLISILILFFGFFKNQKSSETNTPLQANIENTQSTSVNKSVEYKSIYFYNKDNVRTDIYKYDGQNKNVIFTDADEKEKVTKVLGINNDKLFIVMSKDNVDNLYTVSLNSSGKKILTVSNFNKDNLELGSENIAYTEYSNAERSIGYKIFTINLSGKNKEEIANESLNPFNLLIDKKMLYYVVDRSNIFEIYSVELKNNNKNLIAELNQKPDDFYIYNNNIYYLNNNKLFAYNIESKINSEILEAKIESFINFNQYIFYTKDDKIFSMLDGKSSEITAGKYLIKIE
ncbi:MAG: hypothetical protein UR93_C0001G0066 [Berkelbacteria bacterium GW2011_GWA2_35_9]|uniref:Uncharacterized protein n=1 Tax=Berkelbacteria bacterium GW2011_GWA2_35_9 TaxID=1618333 RepID=A0A0G0D4S7_9BACT|nr:MAG: hypothetical protein UR93_C0001G0066 [Berkelbacteria bacterium GW2011_GWA2_35_9]